MEMPKHDWNIGLDSSCLLLPKQNVTNAQKNRVRGAQKYVGKSATTPQGTAC